MLRLALDVRNLLSCCYVTAPSFNLNKITSSSMHSDSCFPEYRDISSLCLEVAICCVGRISEHLPLKSTSGTPYSRGIRLT